MTNTLHRFGDADSFRDDDVVIAVPSRGRHDENAVPKLRTFLEMALPCKPVNLGDARHGGAVRPSKACACMSRFCWCGIFNPSRGRRILEDSRGSTR